MSNDLDPLALKSALRGSGDFAFIAQLTGYNVSYVRKVLDGQRHNVTILKAAKLRIEYTQKCAKRIEKLVLSSKKASH